MNLHPGLLWVVEEVDRRTGAVRSREIIHNLMPTEGWNYLLNVGMKGSAQITNWYTGIYEGNYTPTVADTAAGIAAASTECTTYAESTRQVWTGGTVSGGSVSNSASTANFTSTSNKTIYGGFVVSASAKGATTGTLISVVRFSTSKNFDTNTVLRVTAPITLT